MKSNKKIRVLIFERQAGMMIRLLAFFEARPDIEVVEANQNVQVFLAEAYNFKLRSLMDILRPDAVIVDLREPLQHDLLWLAKIQELTFAPLIAFTDCVIGNNMVSGLKFFAVVRRPTSDEKSILAALRLLAFAVRRTQLSSKGPPALNAVPAGNYRAAGNTELIAIGASTGGTAAILNILSKLPANMPPVLVVQHITPGFGEVFAAHIDRKSQLTARIAQEGEKACPGCVYVAADARHLTVARCKKSYILHCTEGGKFRGHMPSVDILFNSVAEQAGDRAVGVLLSGMGRDGAAGLLQMRQAGALTIGQDESTALIYGMPKAAYEAGAVVRQLPLDLISSELVKHIYKGETGNE